MKKVRETASSLSIFFVISNQFLDTYSDKRHGIMGSGFLPRSPRGFKISKEATFNRRLHRKNEQDFEIFWVLARARIVMRSSICQQIYPVQSRNVSFWFGIVDKLQLATNRIVISWRYFFTNQLFAGAERARLEENLQWIKTFYDYEQTPKISNF